MSHCDIHHECVRRDPIIFYVWQDDIILDLDVTPFIDSSRNYSMGFNSVTNRATRSIRDLEVLQIEWEHLDFDKTKSPTEVWGIDHRENEAGYD
jgi:hypothetical protein